MKPTHTKRLKVYTELQSTYLTSGLCVLLGNTLPDRYFGTPDSLILDSYPEFKMFEPTYEEWQDLSQDVMWFTPEERIMVLEFCKLMVK